MHRFVLIMLIVFASTSFVYAQQSNSESELLVSRVAPGEQLPVLIKLVNFGNSARVDVIVTYKIQNTVGKTYITETETVAVETTAQFVRSLSLPISIPEGTYRVFSSVSYPDQETPAISSFTFEVEHKYFNIFKSTLINYLKIIAALLILTIIITAIIVRRRKSVALLHDYSDVSEKERMYYEIVSDIVTQMRLSIGHEAIKLASRIEGLTIDRKSGKVLEIQDTPSEIISELMGLFEQNYGSNFNISFDKDRMDTRVILKR